MRSDDLQPSAGRREPLAADLRNTRRRRDAHVNRERDGVTIDAARRAALLASTPLGGEGRGAREIAGLLVERHVPEGAIAPAGGKRGMAMREITIVHVAGCPGAAEARATALAVAAGRLDVAVRDVTVWNEAEAIAAGLRGSPTVLVDGRDAEPETEVPLGAMT